MKALPKLIFEDPSEIRTFRKKNGLNQAEFWARIGITQSGGSRYETGRNIPTVVRLMMHIAYAPDQRSARLVDAIRGRQGEASSTASSS